MSELRNKIVLAEGTDYERTIYLNRPKGRKAREMMPKVLAFMAELSKNQTKLTEVDPTQTLLQFWSKEEFEEVLLPFVLQMDTVEGRKYLEEECTTTEILDAFYKAANYMIEESFQRAEVEEALGKSNEEAQEAQVPVATKKTR